MAALAALAALCMPPQRPHSASMQKLSVPVQSTLQDDFATCVQNAKPLRGQW